MTEDNAVLTAIPICCELGVHAIQFNALQLILGFTLPNLKKALEMFSFNLQEQVTSNKHTSWDIKIL
jgi:hypothetical protein